MDEINKKEKPGNDHASKIARSVDEGARSTQGITRKVITTTALAWVLFQLWYASPLPYIIRVGVFNDGQARAIHLAFALFLAFLTFPARKNKHLAHVPVTDWLFATAGALCASYLYLFHQELASRSGAPQTADLITAGIGILLLLEATRRSLGSPLMVVALVFLGYAFAGSWMPDVIAHKGASLNKALSHFWITTEGVFGVALGVSANFVFLFVLFGSLLERAGAGHYFIQVAFSLLGHLRGGPAKAAVVSSGLSGVVSGSSIANVVTTGTFTIPLMKKTGFPAHKAGAIEVAASTNGQLTPPIMGAAAFLMVEYVGIPYLDVIKHALLPAIISYIALFYIVHLEAVKAGLKGLPRTQTRTSVQALLSATGSFTTITLLSAVVYYGTGWIKTLFGEQASWILGSALTALYIFLIWVASRQPDLPENSDTPNTIPAPSPILKRGLYYLLPLVVLLWSLTVERFSPGLSAFWATAVMIAITLTHKPLLMHFRQQNRKGIYQECLHDLIDGLQSGARNMVPIAIATATAGIVVGTVTLTGIGLVMTEFVEWVSGGSLLLMLVFTAFICLVLGMGLPTTANYIVVSTLMAPVIVTLGAQHGLIVPLIAVHLFVFYFGILADDTPPVGLAAFAASAIAKSDPIHTGIQGFTYDIRTAILPFMFIFNTELLLIGVTDWVSLMTVIVGATIAMLVFAAATQGFWITRTRWYETLALLLIAFTLFRPGFWWDKLYPPYHHFEGEHIISALEKLPDHRQARLWLSGEQLDGKPMTQLISLDAGEQDEGKNRLQAMGIDTVFEDNQLVVDFVAFDSSAQKAGIDFDWVIEKIDIPSNTPPKQMIWIPALLLLMVVYFNQRRRKNNTCP